MPQIIQRTRSLLMTNMIEARMDIVMEALMMNNGSRIQTSGAKAMMQCRTPGRSFLGCARPRALLANKTMKSSEKDGFHLGAADD